MLIVFTFSVCFAGLYDYSVQEIFNLIYNDYSGNMHEYSEQEVLNMVYSPSDSALKVTISGLSSDSSYIDTLVFNLGYGDTLFIDHMSANDSTNIEFLSGALFSYIEFTEDAGEVTATDLPVSSDASDGAAQGYDFKIDSGAIFGIRALADGSGGVDSAWVEITGKVVLDSLTADPDSVKGTIWYGGGDDSLHIWTGAGKQTFQLKMAD